MLTYVTDVEGRWDKLERALSAGGVRLVDGEVELGPGATFVFGGDAVDRGPAGRRVVAALLRAKERYGDRVVLLAGNRDLNKLRLWRELGGHPLRRAPAEVVHDPGRHLRWILGSTMGAGEAFAHRAAELAAAGHAADDEAVARSFFEDSAPEGLMARYLARAQLAHRVGRTLFVHGAVTGDSLGVVPGQAPVEGVDRWVDALNTFYADQLAAFARQDLVGDRPAWSAVIAYQAPLPGTGANQASVVYGRLADAHNDPRLPDEAAVAALRRDGVDRLVVGHTPVGDLPAVLRRDGFTLVMADNAYSRLEWGTRTEVDADHLTFTGRCRLDDGRELDVTATVADDEPVVGHVTATGHLVKAALPEGWLLFRAGPDRRVEQGVAAPGGALAPPAPWRPPQGGS